MLPADIRSSHPFFMYEEIQAQPDVVARAFSSSPEELARLGEAAALARRIYLVGCGTSFHAAWVGQYFFEDLLPQSVARAVVAHEMLHHGAPIEPEDFVIGLSHSGRTATTIAALEKAHRAGARTVAITGFAKSGLAAAAQHALSTGYEMEKSWAHTASYTATLAILARLALAARGRKAPEEWRGELAALPEKMRAALALAPQIQALARSFRDRRRFFFIGAGPNWPTAAEGALKMQETNYACAEAIEVEEFLHGPVASADESAVVVLLAPAGSGAARFVDAARAARIVDCGTLALVRPGQEELARCSETALALPPVAEILSPILLVVPLQLFSYFTAVERGVNPDLLRRDDKKYREARASYPL